jgi:phage shock protein A
MKSSLTQIQNTVKSLSNRMEQDENRISGIEDKVEELYQSKTQKKYKENMNVICKTSEPPLKNPTNQCCRRRDL